MGAMSGLLARMLTAEHPEGLRGRNPRGRTVHATLVAWTNPTGPCPRLMPATSSRPADQLLLATTLRGADAALELALQLAVGSAGTGGDPPRLVDGVRAPGQGTWTLGYVLSEDELAESGHDELIADTRARVARFPGVDVTRRADHRGPGLGPTWASHEARMQCRLTGPGRFGELVLGRSATRRPLGTPTAWYSWPGYHL